MQDLKCTPHRGAFHPITDAPIDKHGRPVLPGIRVCGNSDCVKPAHIVNTGRQAKLHGLTPTKRIPRNRATILTGERLEQIARPVTRYELIHKCGVPGCSNPHKTINLCSSHYMQLYRWRKDNNKPRIRVDYSDVLKAATETAGNKLATKDRYCRIKDCTREYEARGLCGLHYQRYLRAKGARW